MNFQVCTIAPTRAIFTPFLPSPPEICACGEAITLEMEREAGICVDCQCEAAGMGLRGGSIQ